MAHRYVGRFNLEPVLIPRSQHPLDHRRRLQSGPGFYGDPIARTPHIDRLAAEGTRYDNAFTSAPSCCPSRSGFMTGVWQIALGAHHQRPVNKPRLPSHIHVITHYFKQAGYFTANLRNVANRPYAKVGTGKDDFGFKPHPEDAWDSSRWEDLKRHQPFYAQLSIFNTHRAWDWYRCAAIKRFQVDPNTVRVPPFYPDVPIVRQDFADYYASIHALDESVGLILERLAKDGLAKNTIVMFIGDHGRPMLRGKQFLYEQGLRIPMILRWPGRIAAGSVVDELISALDFGPTFLAMAGITPPSHMQGRVFWGPQRDAPRDYVFAARDRVDEAVDRIRCVRDHRYKYIRNLMPDMPYAQPQIYREEHYPTRRPLLEMFGLGQLNDVQARFFQPTKPKEELYDLSRDPWEIHTLVDDPNYASELARLRAVLDQRLDKSRDYGAEPEDAADYLKVLSERHRRRVQLESKGPIAPLTWQQKRDRFKSR